MNRKFLVWVLVLVCLAIPIKAEFGTPGVDYSIDPDDYYYLNLCNGTTTPIKGNIGLAQATWSSVQGRCDYTRTGAGGYFVHNTNQSLDAVTGNISFYFDVINKTGVANAFFDMAVTEGQQGARPLIANTIFNHNGGGTIYDYGAWNNGFNATIKVTWDNTNNKVSFYAYFTNGTLAGSLTNQNPVNGDDFNGSVWWYGGDATSYMSIDNIMIYGGNTRPAGTPLYSFSLTMDYPTNGASYNDFNGFINVSSNGNLSYHLINDSSFSTYYTDNDTLIYFNNTLPDGVYSVNVWANDTLGNTDNVSVTFTLDTGNPNITTNLAGNSTAWTYSLYLLANATDTFNLTSFNITDTCGYKIGNSSPANPHVFAQNLTISNCSLGAQTTTVRACDNAGNCNIQAYAWDNRGRLNVSAFNRTGGGIANFSIYLNGTLKGSTTGGFYLVENLTAGFYNISIDAPGFAIDWHNLSVNSTYTEYNFSLYNTNSLYIEVRDESSYSLINNSNLTISWGANEEKYLLNTGGTLSLDNLEPDEYSLAIDGPGYGVRVYTLTIGNRSHQNLYAFLTTSTDSVTFTIKDVESPATLIEGVLATMYKSINNTWTPVESRYSDITGRAQFTYEGDVNYRFYFSHIDYEDLIFYLEPVLFSEYDIEMVRSATFNTSDDFEKVALTWSPSIFYSGANEFKFLIQSPYGELETYGYNITYPGGSNLVTGSNAIGSQLNLNLTIAGASIGDRVELNYFYETTLSGRRNFTHYFDIITGIDNGTMMDNKTSKYGLGLVERAFTLLLITLFVMGIATLIGKPLPGAVLVIGLYGYFVYTGFVEYWLVAVPIIAGALIVFLNNEG